MANYNLDKTWEVAKFNLMNCDPLEVARKAKVEYDQLSKTFKLPFLGNIYSIRFPDGEVNALKGNAEVSLTNRILMLHYLTTANGQPLVKNWISFKELPDGAIYNEPFTRRTIKPMLDTFSDNPQNLVRLAEEIGGKAGDIGDVSVTLPVFPQVAITYVIWEGDEEFPATGTVLFDGSAKAYLPTEDYALLSSAIIWELKSKLKRTSVEK
jgi:hypothetical protein